ncbi:MAG: hypothetical protein AAGD32_17540 [Planctomycetota bacterium]
MSEELTPLLVRFEIGHSPDAPIKPNGSRYEVRSAVLADDGRGVPLEPFAIDAGTQHTPRVAFDLVCPADLTVRVLVYFVDANGVASPARQCYATPRPAKRFPRACGFTEAELRMVSAKATDLPISWMPPEDLEPSDQSSNEKNPAAAEGAEPVALTVGGGSVNDSE